MPKSIVLLHDPEEVKVDFYSVPYNRPVCPRSVCKKHEMSLRILP